MGSLGTEKDWVVVLVIAACWGVSMFLFIRYRLRSQLGDTPGLPARSWSGSIPKLALGAFDVGFLGSFGKRSFHDGLLLVLVAVNVAVLASFYGFRLLPAARSHSNSQ
jgi:hypothetical protein